MVHASLLLVMGEGDMGVGWFTTDTATDFRGPFPLNEGDRKVIWYSIPHCRPFGMVAKLHR